MIANPSPTPIPLPEVAAIDPGLTAAYIAAIVAFVLFALDRAIAIYTRWRDREREGIEMLTEGLSVASLAMIRAGDVDLPDVLAELGVVGTRVQLRITRQRTMIGALIQFCLHAVIRSRGRKDLSGRATLHIITGLFALFGDELIKWHRFQTTAGAISKKMIRYISAPRDRVTGMTDEEATANQPRA